MIDDIVVELAKHRLGEGWQQQFLEQVKSGGIERVLPGMCGLRLARTTPSTWPKSLPKT
ncbi:MAG: DUF3400 domain-containing protein [Halochromatium sp.]